MERGEQAVEMDSSHGSEPITGLFHLRPKKSSFEKDGKKVWKNYAINDNLKNKNTGKEGVS
jgi:hypothetical protein